MATAEQPQVLKVQLVLQDMRSSPLLSLIPTDKRDSLFELVEPRHRHPGRDGPGGGVWPTEYLTTALYSVLVVAEP